MNNQKSCKKIIFKKIKEKEKNKILVEPWSYLTQFVLVHIHRFMSLSNLSRGSDKCKNIRGECRYERRNRAGANNSGHMYVY